MKAQGQPMRMVAPILTDHPVLCAGFRAKRLMVIVIQAHMRRKLCQMAFRARKALLGPPERPSYAMPDIRQPSRYLLPKARPPSRLWERRQAAKTLTQSQSDGALVRKHVTGPLPPLYESSFPTRAEQRGVLLPNARSRSRLQTTASTVAFSNFDRPSSSWMVAPPSMDEIIRLGGLQLQAHWCVLR